MANEKKVVADHDVTDDEIDDLWSTHSPEDLDPTDAPEDERFDDVLCDIDNDGDNDCADDHDEIDEAVVSMQRRMRLASRMRMMAPRLARLRATRRMRMAPTERLQYRARKAALMIIRKRVAGANTVAHYSKLSPSQRISIDKQIQQRYGKNLTKVIGSMAQRLLQIVRRKETQRLATARAHANESISVVEKMEHGGADAGDTNLIYQMGKVFDAGARGHNVMFSDGSSIHMHPRHAKHVILAYRKLRTPIEKQQFTLKHGKSAADFKSGFGHVLKDSQWDITSPSELGARELPVRSGYIASSTTSEAQGFKVTGRAVGFTPQNLPDFPPTSHAVPTASMSSEGGNDTKKLAHHVGDADARASELVASIKKWMNDPRGQAFEGDIVAALKQANKNKTRAEMSDPATNAQRTRQSNERDALTDRQARERQNLAKRQDSQRQALQRTRAGAGARHYTTLSADVMSDLEQKAADSGIELDIVLEVYFRGLSDAVDRGLIEQMHQPHAYNRLNSFLSGGAATELDADLILENFIGTDASRQKFAAATPGQSTELVVSPISAPIPWATTEQSQPSARSHHASWKDIMHIIAGKERGEKQASDDNDISTYSTKHTAIAAHVAVARRAYANPYSSERGTAMKIERAAHLARVYRMHDIAGHLEQAQLAHQQHNVQYAREKLNQAHRAVQDHIDLARSTVHRSGSVNEGHPLDAADIADFEKVAARHGYEYSTVHDNSDIGHYHIVLHHRDLPHHSIGIYKFKGDRRPTMISYTGKKPKLTHALTSTSNKSFRTPGALDKHLQDVHKKSTVKENFEMNEGHGDVSNRRLARATRARFARDKFIARYMQKLERRSSIHVKKDSTGTVKTVYDGSVTSYPLHPEHRAAIAKLNHGETTKFRDETGSHIVARRDGDKVYLKHADSIHTGNRETAVDRHQVVDEAMGHPAHTAADFERVAERYGYKKVGGTIQSVIAMKHHKTDHHVHIYRGRAGYKHGKPYAITTSSLKFHHSPWELSHDLAAVHRTADLIDKESGR